MIFLRVARHGLYLHGLFQSILQVVNLLLGEGGSCQGKQSLDEPIPLMVGIDRVAEFPDRVLESPHHLPFSLSFFLLNLPELGQTLLVRLGKFKFPGKIPLNVCNC